MDIIVKARDGRLTAEDVIGRDRFFVDEDGETALHWAAGCGNLEAVGFLLETIDGKIKATDERIRYLFLKNTAGKPALHCAAQNGHTSIVKLLLTVAGLDEVRTKNKNTALMLAIKSSHLETCKVFIDFGVKELEHEDMIFRVVESRDLEICKLFIDSGVKGIEHEALLYHAVESGNVEICKLFLRPETLKWECPVDCSYTTPLHLAVELRNFQICKLLIDAKNLRDGEGRLPKDLAKQRNLKDIEKLLS